MEKSLEQLMDEMEFQIASCTKEGVEMVLRLKSIRKVPEHRELPQGFVGETLDEVREKARKWLQGISTLDRRVG